MARTRAKSPPRLTRDAERLIALALGLNASGSLTEDRFWEAEMSTLAAKLLEKTSECGEYNAAFQSIFQEFGRFRTAAVCSQNAALRFTEVLSTEC